MCKLKYIHYAASLIMAMAVFTGCKKLVELDAPKNTITTDQMFSNSTQAEWAVAAIYSKMIHGAGFIGMSTIGETNFGAGLSTIAGGLSSDEFAAGLPGGDINTYSLVTNTLNVKSALLPTNIWKTAYKTIYDANAAIEGLAAAKPGVLLDSVKNQLMGEALALRAFSYFYLVNFFGDLPLALTIDFSQTVTLSRAPVSTVYTQIIKDLTDAAPMLTEDFSVGKGERVRINRWFVEALLSRVYLYNGQYQNAITHASNVINKNNLFSLEPDLANVFSKASKEAIFQLKSITNNGNLKNAVPEGMALLNKTFDSKPAYRFNTEFLNSFAIGDKRKTAWMLSSTDGLHPNKYTLGAMNSVLNGVQPQYYVVMRLAELHLIRAEANLLLSNANKDAAIADINAVRQRTGAGLLSNTLTAEQVKTAIADERKFEFFAEWGHRWFDLKRTGKATEVLSQITAKQPWRGDYQLLYPIPESEILNNINIKQNYLYDVQ